MDGMTPKEALNEITSKRKWYAVCGNDRRGESTYRVMALRIHNGTAESSSMRRFFEKFGYELKIEITKSNDKINNS